MVTFEQITKANKELTTVDIKGKDYVVVPQRVKAFRMLYPEGFILTDIVSHEGGVIVMQAKAGYYDENGNPLVLGTGLAFEKADSSYINKTSYIENCETSAIGRALGFLGLGIDSAICSAEELVNAMNNQGDKPRQQNSKPVDKKTGPENGTVEQAKVLPPNPEPVDGEKPGAFLQRRITEMKAEFKNFDFLKIRKTLIDGGVVPDIPSATMTMEQAKNLADAVYKTCAQKVPA